jgi:DNA-binding LacI/PurR family transcriptional regulator
VSRVLNNHPAVSPDVRQRVVAATNEAGYVAAVGRKSTTNVAFVHTGESSLGSPFDAALMYGMSCGMEEHGYDLLILDARRARLPGESFTQMFMRKGVRGAVLRTTLATRGACEAIAEEGFPAVVVADRFPENPKVNYIYACSRESSREAVEHLVDLGHRRIAICINVVDDNDHADRVAGYTEALAAAGIAFDPRLVLRVPAFREPGAQALRRLRSIPDGPTAVFMTDAAAVVGLLGEARRTGVRVPADLSVVGFDDTQMRFGLCPELTAVCQDAEALGREAFAACHLLINGQAELPPVRKAMRTWLEVHGSTSPPTSVAG